MPSAQSVSHAPRPLREPAQRVGGRLARRRSARRPRRARPATSRRSRGRRARTLAGRRRGRRRSDRDRCAAPRSRTRPDRPLVPRRAQSHPDAGVDELERLGLLAAPGDEQQRRVPHAVRYPVAAGDRVRLLDEGRRGDELTRVHVHAGPVGERDREDAQRAGVAREPRPRGWRGRATSRRPTARARRLRRDGHASQSQRRSSSPSAGAPRGTRRASARSRGDGRGVAVREPRRDAIQQQIDRTGGRGPGGAARAWPPRDLARRRRCAEATGEDRRARAPRDTSHAPARRRAARAALAASSSSGGRLASALRAKTICARRRSRRARCRSSRGQLSAIASSIDGARRARRRRTSAWAAARARGPRRPGSGVSSAARGRNAAAAATPTARLRPVGRALELGGHDLVRPRGGMRRDATPGGRDRRPGRSPRPARGAPRVGRCWSPRDRRPSARAGAGSAPGRRTRSDPRPRPERPRRPDPEPSAARHSRLTSPTGSAAATSRRRRVSAGRTRAAAGSSARCGWPAAARPDARTRPPSPRARQAAWQLQQRERVPAGLGDDPVAHPRRPAVR